MVSDTIGQPYCCQNFKCSKKTGFEVGQRTAQLWKAGTSYNLTINKSWVKCIIHTIAIICNRIQVYLLKSFKTWPLHLLHMGWNLLLFKQIQAF